MPREGFNLYYRILGNKGSSILILSGGPGSDNRYMQPVADELSKNYRAIMLEQRGTGRSVLKKYDSSTINWKAYFDDIEALRKHLGINKFIFVGNSWGMMLALAYGGTYPDRVEAIVTIGSGPITSAYGKVFSNNRTGRLSPTEIEQRLYWLDSKRSEADPKRAIYEIQRAEMSAYYYDRKLALKSMMELHLDDMNPYIFPAFAEIASGFDLRPKLKVITAPVLLIQGRQDIAGEANVYEAHLLIKGSILKFIEKCGHSPWEEHPEQTWKIVNEFLAALPK
ncbi:MAG: alpha/beta hydrolase [Pyrinomonadaceae bacterium]